MRTFLPKAAILASLVSLCAPSGFAARQMESLDRGVVAVKVANGVFVSWRVLGTDAATTSFNVYRNGTKVNATPVSGATNLVDAAGTTTSTYTVRAIVDGAEQGVGGSAATWATQVLKIPLQRPAATTMPDATTATYTPADMSVGDVDGDGQWELIVKWDPSNAKDNSQSGYTGNVYLDAYELDGKRLWRIDLGVNIRAGAHYTQFMVADFDVDGKAEVACKTAPGTKDGTGVFLSRGPAATDNDATDYRTTGGYILTGPEYLTVFNGQTGKELATANYTPARGTVSSWGDGYGNRVDRFLAGIAWLDGKKPSMIFQRGYYTRMAVTAYDWNGTALTERWAHNSATSGQGCFGQGNHNLTIGDIDADGFDEVVEGACAIDHDGKFMYRTGYGHGDAIHMGDFDPDNPGLELWQNHEDANSPYGYELHDARTGKLLWGTKTGNDNGRANAADIDAASRGHEMWSSSGASVFSAKGAALSGTKPSVNFRVYWDGDLLDELLDGSRLDKWNGNGTGRLITLTGTSCNGTKATPNFSGDILGDWREEVILHDDANLYLHTTTTATTHRLYTLAHDPNYRAAMAWQNTAYNQPPHLGFWLGAGIDKAPKPDIVLTRSTTSIGTTSHTGNTLLSARVHSTGITVDFPWSGSTRVSLVDSRGRTLAAVQGTDRAELALPNGFTGSAWVNAIGPGGQSSVVPVSLVR
jgi:hypothetical protein